MPSSSEINWAIGLIKESIKQHGPDDVFFIGAYPRTLAMGSSLSNIHDLDVGLSSYSLASRLANLTAEKANGTVGQGRSNHYAVSVDLGVIEADFKCSTVEEQSIPYLHAWNIEPTPLAMDVFSRDFTINSLAIPVTGHFKIVDLTGRGLKDIERGRIATVIPPEDIIRKDPLIMARAIRLACKYNFSIDKMLWDAIKANNHLLLNSISSHRLGIEADALSKYQASEDLLLDAGLDYLIKPKMQRAAASGGDFYKEEVIFFPSKKRYESAYVCYVTATLAEADTYVVTAYLVESYLGRYAFRKDFYFKSTDSATDSYERIKGKILDIKKEFIKNAHAQAELTGYMRRVLQDEVSELTPAIDQVATFLNPKNNIKKGPFGSDNNVSLKNTDNQLKSYTLEGTGGRP